MYGNGFGPGSQYHDWTSFISDTEFCMRACIGKDATTLCNHIYDLQGCQWVCLFSPRSSFMYVIDKLTYRTSLRTTMQVSMKTVTVTLRKRILLYFSVF